MIRIPQPVFAAEPPPPSGEPPPAGVPSLAPAGDPPKIPDGLPPQFWDSQAGQVNTPELVKAYGEIATFKAQHEERLAALPKDPKDYKLEIKLPDTVKLPEGFKPEIDEKDPRVPAVRAFAHKYQLPQDALNELVALDAQMQVEEFVANEAAIQAEMKKLGENGKARVGAIESFLKANVAKDEYEALRPVIGNALAVQAIEKLIAKAVTQQVPGNRLNGDQPLKPSEVPIEKRWYGNGAQPQQRTS